MHGGGRTLKGLHQIGLDRVLEQRGHRAVRLDIARVDRFSLRVVGDQDAAQAALEVVDIRGKAEDRHDLGGDGDNKVILARNAVDLSAESDDNVSESAVIHVKAPLDENAALVNPERVALLEMVVQHRAAEIVRRRDGVHISRKVKVDVLHRQHLRVAAARGSSLDTEHRAERRLTERDDRLLSDLRHRLAETGGGGGFTLARGGGVDGGDKYQLSVGI